MSKTDAGGGPSATNCDPAEQLAIEHAVAHMECRGWIDEPDEQIIEDLTRLYHESPASYRIASEFNGDVLHDLLVARPAEYLAGAWQIEQEEHWQRYQAPRWSCPCGVTFGAYEFTSRKYTLFTLTADGLFDAQVTDCPSCGRNLAKVQAEQADGQLGFAF